MRAVLQRVARAAVRVDGETVATLDGPGLLALVGVTHDDGPEQADRMAAKIFGLRVFDGPAGQASACDLGLPVLVVSEFTLYGQTDKGRRPSWSAAAPSPVAEPLVHRVVEALQVAGAVVSTGRFGAHMQVELVNDGPVTLVLET